MTSTALDALVLVAASLLDLERAARKRPVFAAAARVDGFDGFADFDGGFDDRRSSVSSAASVFSAALTGGDSDDDDDDDGDSDADARSPAVPTLTAFSSPAAYPQVAPPLRRKTVVRGAPYGVARVRRPSPPASAHEEDEELEDASPRATAAAAASSMPQVIVNPTIAPPSPASLKSRANFTPDVLDILTSWLVAHKQDPYPTVEQKRALASQCGLNMKQVNNWFINARRRRI